MQKYTFLSREIHLLEYGQDFLDIKCTDIDQNQFEWECTLSSVMKIITISIVKKQTFDSVSEFIFKHQLKNVYINTLQDHYLIEGTKYIWAQNNDYFFLTNNSKFIKKNHIVMFKRNSFVNYSYYYMPIQDKQVVQMSVSGNDELIVFFLDRGKLLMKKYAIGEYELVTLKSDDMLFLSLEFLQKKYLVVFKPEYQKDRNRFEPINYQRQQRDLLIIIYSLIGFIFILISLFIYTIK